MILAVFAAVAINAILASAVDAIFHATGIYPPFGQSMKEYSGLMAIALSYRVVITIFAAYITAMIAKEKAKTAIYFSGILGTMLWLIGAIVGWDLAPVWFHIVGIASALPLAIIGWKLYERYVNKHS